MMVCGLDPDVDSYGRFLEYSARVYKEGYLNLAVIAFLDFASMIKGRAA
jgi:phytoene desaturase